MVEPAPRRPQYVDGGRIPAQRGKHRKKAIVVISDGNDTNSVTDVRALRSLIRETEVLIYAVGIDGDSRSTRVIRPGGPTNRPLPIPWPIPGGGGRRPPRWWRCFVPCHAS